MIERPSDASASGCTFAGPPSRRRHHAGTRRSVASVCAIACLAFASLAAQAAIPQSERDVLLAFYAGTNGDSWTDHTGWNGAPGTECSWHGVSCDPIGAHVIAIDLRSNHLSGSLPALNDLPKLFFFHVEDNAIGGALPSLFGLNDLRFFHAENNQLTGSIPSLSGLANLQAFIANGNQLSGAIPSLSGLTNLLDFHVQQNRLSGPLPSLSGLTSLLTFNAGINALSGSIPPLTGSTNLQELLIGTNQLTGAIPSLAELKNLVRFHVDYNQLTGPIPSLANLVHLAEFQVNNNMLRGDVPAVPDPNNLIDGVSILCANHLNPTPNAAWDAATGTTPWYQYCTPLPDHIFGDGFDPP